MNLLILVIFLPCSQGQADVHASCLKKAELALVRKGKINDSGILAQPSFNLTVNKGSCYSEDNLFRIEGNVGESLPLDCPLPSSASLNSSITWMKNCSLELGSGESLHFQSLSTSDAGYYTCTWSCSNGAQGSRTLELVVNEGHVALDPRIILPLNNSEIKVDMGKAAVVSCKAVLHSEPEFDGIFWMRNSSFISNDPSEPVFYNDTVEQQMDGKYLMTASLVFRAVTPEHINTKYTCKLRTPTPYPIYVSITLTQRGDFLVRSPYLCVGIVAMFVGIASVFTIIYVKLKIDIVLFLRDLRGASFSDKDGKQYDAYIMYYKVASEEALTEEEQILIPRILETEFGYRLSLYERDILPGRAAPEAVLEYIGQSRRLLLIPGTLETEHESLVNGMAEGGDELGLLSGLHVALVERQTRLILVEKAPRGKLNSLPESLQLLVRSGGTVVWKGERSMPLSSPFWKKLRCCLPARRSPKRRAEYMTML